MRSSSIFEGWYCKKLKRGHLNKMRIVDFYGAYTENGGSSSIINNTEIWLQESLEKWLIFFLARVLPWKEQRVSNECKLKRFLRSSSQLNGGQEQTHWEAERGWTQSVRSKYITRIFQSHLFCNFFTKNWMLFSGIAAQWSGSIFKTPRLCVLKHKHLK